MANITGKWKKVSAEGVDDFIKVVAPNAAAETVTKLTNWFGGLNVVEEYTVSGNTTTRKVFVGGELKWDTKNELGKDTVMDTGALGKSTVNGKIVNENRVEVTEKAEDGRVGKLVLRVDGGKLYNEYTVSGKTLVRVFDRQ